MTDDSTTPPRTPAAKTAAKPAAKPRTTRTKAPANKPKAPAAKAATTNRAGTSTKSTARKPATAKPATAKPAAAKPATAKAASGAKAKTPAETLVKQVEASVADVTASAEKATKEAETMAQTVTVRATEVMEDLRLKAEDSGRKIEAALSQAAGSVARMPEMQSKAADAMTASQQVISAGVAELSNAVLAYTKSAMTEGYDAAKAVATAATIQDVVQVQTEFARSRLQSSVDYTHQLVEIVSRMSRESTQSMVAGAQELMAMMRGGTTKS